MEWSLDNDVMDLEYGVVGTDVLKLRSEGMSRVLACEWGG